MRRRQIYAQRTAQERLKEELLKLEQSKQEQKKPVVKVKRKRGRPPKSAYE